MAAVHKKVNSDQSDSEENRASFVFWDYFSLFLLFLHNAL